jgi:hypothetical protein
MTATIAASIAIPAWAGPGKGSFAPVWPSTYALLDRLSPSHPLKVSFSMVGVDRDTKVTVALRAGSRDSPTYATYDMAPTSDTTYSYNWQTIVPSFDIEAHPGVNFLEFTYADPRSGKSGTAWQQFDSCYETVFVDYKSTPEHVDLDRPNLSLTGRLVSIKSKDAPQLPLKGVTIDVNDAAGSTVVTADDGTFKVDSKIAGAAVIPRLTSRAGGLVCSIEAYPRPYIIDTQPSQLTGQLIYPKDAAGRPIMTRGTEVTVTGKLTRTGAAGQVPLGGYRIGLELVYERLGNVMTKADGSYEFKAKLTKDGALSVFAGGYSSPDGWDETILPSTVQLGQVKLTEPTTQPPATQPTGSQTPSTSPAPTLSTSPAPTPSTSPAPTPSMSPAPVPTKPAPQPAKRIATRFVKVNAGPEPVRKGRKLTVKGALQAKDRTVWRALDHHRVYVWFKAKGTKKWTRVAVTTTNDKGLIQKSFKAKKDGSWRLSFTADKLFLGTVSGWDYVDVR